MQTAGILQRSAGVFRSSPLIRWLVQARRLPMYYAVTIMVSIFIHYAPSITLLLIPVTLLVQAGLFRFFDFVKRHPVIGGVLYIIGGIAVLSVSGWLIRMGYDQPVFGPEEPTQQIWFLIWFMTPQSVLVTSYLGYTIALYLMFSYFIGSITYYFTYVRYRVLMSFVIMLFPFEIYAKENETMPIPCIILLFAFYFAVMIYCRQARTEDPAVTAPVTERGGESLTMPSGRSSYAGIRPELLDGRFLRSAALFLAASCIAVLVIPKPKIQADRRAMDSMINMASLSDYLMDSIKGFADDSDGGGYSQNRIRRALYYTKATEPLNLRIRTLTNYHYDTDSWSASEYDLQPNRKQTKLRNAVGLSGFETFAGDPRPVDLNTALHDVLNAHPDLAEKWGMQAFAASPRAVPADYERALTLETAGPSAGVFAVPLGVYAMHASEPPQLYQNRSGIIFRYNDVTRYQERFGAEYISPTFADSESVRLLVTQLDREKWADFLFDMLIAENTDLENGRTDSGNFTVLQAAAQSYSDAEQYADSVISETPESVRSLAESLTEGMKSDYEKADAIWKYLKFTDFTYSLEFQKTASDNTETFLLQHKTGVCYQFAGAMTELCRAAGLPTRYVEGYSMSQIYDRLTSDWDYVISTEHGHAFTEVYIAGYGWMPFDATVGSTETGMENAQTNVISKLQIWGIALLAAALLAAAAVIWLIPMLREKLFRRKFRREMSPSAVQAAFARLRNQWKADPALTVRELCKQSGGFLDLDLSQLADDVEQTVYAERCTPELAKRVYGQYCAAFDAWKPAVRRHRRGASAGSGQCPHPLI